MIMATTTNDPRQGWTSASNAQYDALCPGRHLAQRGMPEQTSVYSESGLRVHSALAAFTNDDKMANKPIIDRLTPAEKECYESSLAIQRSLCGTLFPKAATDGYQEWREERYWATFKFNNVEYKHSGQADFVARSGTRVLILDYKTLFGEVAESPRNLQLRDLACLVAGHFVPTTEVTVAIVQPRLTQKPELCVYTKDDLARASKEMFDRVFKCHQPNAPRVAGELQCKACRARTNCVERQRWASAMIPPALATFTVPMHQWTPEQCAVAANGLGPAEKLLDDIKAMLKQRLGKDPASVPGWMLKPGAMREKIVNAQAVFDRFNTLGGKIDAFMPCVDVAKGKLREALGKLTGAKGKSLDAAMKTLTDGLVEAKQTEPSLARSDK